MLIAISVGSILLGYFCGAYTAKGKEMTARQSGLLWLITAFVTFACVLFYMAGGVLVYAGCYLIFCVSQLVGLLLHSDRIKPDQKG